MATRYIYATGLPPMHLDFEWHAGTAIQQRRRSSKALRNAMYSAGVRARTLEVSSASDKELGIKLSAFNLKILNEETGAMNTLECLYHGTKRYQSGDRPVHLFGTDSLVAKKYEAPSSWGYKDGFEYKGVHYKGAGVGASLYYNWLYIYALATYNKELATEILSGGYVVFTDVQAKFLPQAVCQAQSCSQFVAFASKYTIEEISTKLKAFEGYMELLKEFYGGVPEPKALTAEDCDAINAVSPGNNDLQPMVIDEPVAQLTLVHPFVSCCNTYGVDSNVLDNLHNYIDLSDNEWDPESCGLMLSVVLCHRMMNGRRYHDVHREFCSQVLKCMPREWLASLTSRKVEVAQDYASALELGAGKTDVERFANAFWVGFDKTTNVADNLLHIACAYDCDAVVSFVLDELPDMVKLDTNGLTLEQVVDLAKAKKCKQLISF